MALGIAALQPYGYTYDILIYPRQLKAALKFVSVFPDQPFVVVRQQLDFWLAESAASMVFLGVFYSGAGWNGLLRLAAALSPRAFSDPRACSGNSDFMERMMARSSM